MRNFSVATMRGRNYKEPKRFVALVGFFLFILYFTFTQLENPSSTKKLKYKANLQGTRPFRSDSRHNNSKPNIVFILADDLGYNDVGYHGSEIRTPNLDELAKEGIKLENYYVQSLCTPSRAQLLSGKYQIHTGLQHSLIYAGAPYCLPTDIPTLPEKLREAGYVTHMVGKWHIGFYKKECHPLERGFDSFYGILAGQGDHFSHNNTSLIKGTKVNGYDFWENFEPAWSASGIYSTFLYNDRVNKILDNHDREKPLFLYVPFQSVHRPLQVPKTYLQGYKNISDSSRRLYAGMTTCMDEAVGNIVRKLKETEMWSNTVFIFSTDNGGVTTYGGNNWPLRGWKNSLWEGGVRAVGFILSELLPVNVRGSTSKQLMDISDWFPTLVQGVSGQTLDGLDLDGFNMWDALRSGAAPPRSELVHNIDPWPNHPTEFSTTIRAAIRVGHWKLLTGGPGASGGKWVVPPGSKLTPPKTNDDRKKKKVWLFNITADPNEIMDLSGQHPEVVENLVEKLKGYYKNSVPPIFPPIAKEANPQLHGGLWKAWA